MAFWRTILLAVTMACVCVSASAQQAGRRVALVIGVSDYSRERAEQEAQGFLVPPSLPNAVRDAQSVAEALASKGFQVTRLNNPDKRQMLAAINTFAGTLTSSGPDAVGVFYFAGHGAQGRPALERDIDNYLIPVAADLATEVDLESEALGLSRISAALRPGERGAVVLILDACRNFALPAASRSGSISRGLAEARAAPGTIIAYSTSPGSVAADGPPGRNGPYAEALSAQIRAAAGTRVEDVFIEVRNRVLRATNNQQTPWENGSLRRAVTLGVAPASSVSSVPDTASQMEIERLRQENQRLASQVMVSAPSPRFDLGALPPDLASVVRQARTSQQAAQAAERRAKQAETNAESAARRAARGAPGTSNSAVYQGDSLDSMLGYGILTTQSGFRFFGQFRQGKLWGYGGYTFPGHRQYAGPTSLYGEYENNDPHGHAVIAWPDGAKFEGQVSRGAKAGVGVITYADGSRYEGQWAGDRKNGYGVHWRASGDVEQMGRWTGDQFTTPH